MNIKKELEKYNYKHLRNITNQIIYLASVNGLKGIFQEFIEMLDMKKSIHELKHTYATLLISNSIDFKIIIIIS